MPLSPGTCLGPYLIQGPLGAGGMGEVYRALDPKLDRLVAIKVLPLALGQQGDLLHRFEREAKAVAALNHPNILGIYDFGREGEHSFAVMELLEGESLRERLKTGPLAPKKALEIAHQMAEGLAAAHARGIVHRDIKPENIFLTREGRVKVLDFGLAKQLPGWTGAGSSPSLAGELTGGGWELPLEGLGKGESPSDQPTRALAAPYGASGDHTELGVIMGTVGYMAPEQVRGQVADHRADIFAFGVVLYEMLTGRRAFQKETPAQTLAAILEEDPLELTGTRTQVPPALERLVFHCLEKEPGRRFQSMQDLAYDLANLASLSSAGGPGAVPPGPRKAWSMVGSGAAAMLALALLLWASDRLRLGKPAPPPTFQRLSFIAGTIESARFGPDGKTLYFSQRVGGGRPEIFVLHPGATEAKPLGIQDALLLGVSGTGELALLRSPRLRFGGRNQGLLARAPAEGGALRELQEDVVDAAWDGEGLATLSLDPDFQFTLEFPPGKKLLSGTWTSRTLRHLRPSRDGARLALLDSDATHRAEVVLYDREGRRRVVFTKLGDSNGETLTGLAWGPGGEIWVSELQGAQTALWAVSPAGKQRILWRGAGAYQLLDVSAEGRILLAQHQVRRGVLAQRAGEAQARELSILGDTQAKGLSADGQSLLLLESPVMDGGHAKDAAYLRPLDGGPALRLGPGLPQTLSPDGRWVHLETSALDPKDLDPAWITAWQEAGLDAKDLPDPRARGRFLLFVPTRLGRPFAVPLPAGMDDPGYAFLLPDGQRVVVAVNVNGKDRWVLLDRGKGAPRLLTREGLGIFYAGLQPLSPDARQLIVSGNSKDWFIQPLAGGEPRPIRGMQAGERVLGWSADGAAIYLRPELSVLPVTLTRLDLATGARKVLLAYTLPDPAGHLQTRGVFLTPDAKAFAFTYEKKLSELYLVEGIT